MGMVAMSRKQKPESKVSAGGSSGHPTGDRARRRDVYSGASDSGGRAETTVLNQLRQVNERRRQMMVQDKLLTAILNSMFQNMVSIGTGLILTSQSMQAGVGTLTVGTSPCLSTCRL